MEHKLEGHPVPVAPSDDEISLVEIANAILRNWRVVAVFPVVLALVVGLWTFSRQRMYAASASFIPLAAEGRGGGNAAALAQQFGVNLGTERRGQSPQFYVDLVQSLAILRPLVESEYEIPGENGPVRRGTLTEMLEVEPRAGLPAWRVAAEQVRRRHLSTSLVRETGVVTFTVSAPAPGLAEQVADRLLHLLNEFNLEMRQRRAEEEGRFIGGRVAEAEAELLRAEGGLQDFLKHNRVFRNSPELVFEHDRLQRQVAIRQEVYTSLLRSREDARIDAVRDTPLVTVIDHPGGSAEPRARGTVLRALLAFTLGLIIAIFVAFLSEFNRRGRESGDSRYRELQGLARRAWDDLRRPWRWLRRGDKPVAPGGS